MLKVLHVVARMQEASGVTVFCREVCEQASALGMTVALLSGQGKGDIVVANSVQTHAIPVRRVGPFRAELLREVPQAMRSLLESFAPDVVHAHGLWDPVVHIGVAHALRGGVPLVLSPHGMLNPWALQHHAMRKRAAWYGYQRRDVLCATLLHATAQQEHDELRNLGFQQPIAVIPLGIHLDRVAARSLAAERRLLFLSRIHPIKGLFNLVDAWAHIRAPGWRVVVAGPDEGGHLAQVRTRVCALGLDGVFDFPGALYGDSKREAFLSADIFVLPSYSENFGVVVAEALAAGVPVITTRQTPWSDLEEYRCGWWVDGGVEPLVNALKGAVSLSDAERREMGLRGRALAADKYSWRSVTRELLAAYSWVTGRAEMPSCVEASSGLGGDRRRVSRFRVGC